MNEVKSQTKQITSIIHNIIVRILSPKRDTMLRRRGTGGQYLRLVLGRIKPGARWL